MEFRQIRYALSVAKERSFTKAATRLNISQSAVSEQVRLLEDAIGFALFAQKRFYAEPWGKTLGKHALALVSFAASVSVIGAVSFCIALLVSLE